MKDMREGRRRNVKQVWKGMWWENRMLVENEIKSETDEWTAGTRNEVIEREMKGEREDECSVTFLERMNWKIDRTE